MLLIRPKVGRDWLSFASSMQNIQEGYRAAARALEHFETYIEQPGGIFPRKRVEISVSKEKCIGCGLCAGLAPTYMGMDATGKAYARTRVVEWSAADGDFVHHCPTSAIEATRIEMVTPPHTHEHPVVAPPPSATGTPTPKETSAVGAD